jgi:hypothetical protein
MQGSRRFFGRAGPGIPEVPDLGRILGKWSAGLRGAVPLEVALEVFGAEAKPAPDSYRRELSRAEEAIDRRSVYDEELGRLVERQQPTRQAAG